MAMRSGRVRCATKTGRCSTATASGCPAARPRGRARAPAPAPRRRSAARPTARHRPRAQPGARPRRRASGRGPGAARRSRTGRRTVATDRYNNSRSGTVSADGVALHLMTSSESAEFDSTKPSDQALEKLVEKAERNALARADAEGLPDREGAVQGALEIRHHHGQPRHHLDVVERLELRRDEGERDLHLAAELAAHDSTDSRRYG